jgi:hypothetical protein
LVSHWENLCQVAASLAGSLQQRLARGTKVAVDEQLNVRMRAAIGDRDGVTEKKMMGGVCFLLHGNMIGGADRTKDGEGRFMFRVGKDNDAAAAALPGGEPMVQGGRRMSGLYFIAEDACPPDVLAQWLDLAVSFAETLPKK